MDFKKPTPQEWMNAVKWSSTASDDFNKLKPEYYPHSFAELIDTYPEAKGAAKRAAKGQIKTLEREISSLSDFRDIWSNDINKMHFSKQAGMIAYLDNLVERLRAGYEKEIKKYQYQLTYLENMDKPEEEKPKGDPITPERIYRARQSPINEMLRVERGTALCLFHDDRRPSMKIYKDNHAFCFSCGHKADAIDIDMKLSGRTFQESVRFLAP